VMTALLQRRLELFEHFLLLGTQAHRRFDHDATE